MIVQVEQVDAWLRIARPGDQFHYATRPWLSGGLPAAARMRELSDRGLVNLVQKRSDLVKGEFAYLAQRTRLPLNAKPPAPRPAERAVGREAQAVDALLPVLARAARFGRPCPTDAALAERSGIPRDTVQDVIDALRRSNTIRVHAAPAPTLRIVTIVGTGHRTGLVR